VIPSWLAQGNPPGVPAAAGSGSASFLEKTIDAAAAFTAQTLLCDRHANRSGLLQRIDPRCKLAAILALIIAVSLLRTPSTVWGVWLAALILARLSGIAPRLFLGRVVPFVLLFGALVALPALFNVITPGDPLWVVARLGHSREIGPYHIPAELAVTRQGVLGGALFTGRVAASLSLALLLPLTTRWNELLRAFAAFRVPQLFVLVLAMTYRYIALLVRTVAELHEARTSRTVRYLPTGAEQRWVASRMGYLFGKSYRLSQEVHDAMLARGFAGEVKSLEPRKAGKWDVVWMILVLLLSIMLIVFDRVNCH
jgi:cobalt/nickel transport system permease protein